HDELADHFSRNIALISVRNFIHDLVDEIFDDFWTDGPFLAGFLDAGQEFFLGKFLMPSVALQDHEAVALDFLVSREAMTAFRAFAAAADRSSFTRSARINDFIVLTAAFRTTHRSATANCG